ncbi:MAG: glucose-6-phosphate dehydrogenase [Gammaproteobacteria bacterium]|nr:glucose-6-phosphate dehydrogenase [Gammaproteobacteria bacterium]
MATGEPCTFVIFGATGNLASLLLLPALYQLDVNGHLPPKLRFVACARREMPREQWLSYLQGVLQERLPEHYRSDAAASFAQRFDYVSGDLHDAAMYQRLLQRLGRVHANCENIIFYLAIKPADFDDVVEHLNRAGINRQRGRHRIVVEKPFGEDIDSARQLNAKLHRYFDEEQIYRIDHFLGKEAVQNLFVFRFANTLIEPIWNRQVIDHVQITVAEAGGIGNRADYYDRAGALRDMVQNHLLQLLAVVAMEPPAQLEADALRDEKVKVLRSIRPIPLDAVDSYAVRGQYVAGNGLPGYCDEPNVPRDSATETFVAAKFYIDNWRWHGVPFYLRTGKRLARQTSFIAIRCRQPPQLLFDGSAGDRIDPNGIILSIQPDEGMRLEIQAKQPGLVLRSRPLSLNASYRTTQVVSMEAYQTLLLDVIEGDRSLFLRFDEVEWSWRVVDPILQYWAKNKDFVHTYPAGTSGPEEANRLFDHKDQAWRNEG